MIHPPLHLDTATTAALAGLAASLASFAWAMLRFFTLPGGSHAGVAAIRWLGTAFGLGSCAVLLLLGAESVRHAALSLVIAALGLALFWSAIAVNRRQPPSFAFSDDLPANLVREGPYRRIRHPVYTAYLLGWLITPSATGEPLTLLPFLVMACTYSVAARHEERKFEATPLRDDYARYRQQAGLFWPRFR